MVTVRRKKDSGRWKLHTAVAEMKEEFPRYRTSLAIVCEYSQNQSQGIELDVHKEKMCAEMEGMSLIEVVADEWLCGEDATGRGGLVGGVV